MARTANETCDTWRTDAGSLGSPKIYGVTIVTGTLTCGSQCRYGYASSAPFSLLPPGKYQVDANRRIYVETGNGTNSEHWFMSTNVWSAGDTISAVTNTDDLPTFACNTCGTNSSLTVYAPTYTEVTTGLPTTCP